jgi:8-oxo-dGTP pyrophosphatase MutT (NUDIX family)
LKIVPQAGGVVVRMDGDRLSVLLVRAKKNPALWIFPKGHIEAGESAAEAALREVREEAGVDGELMGPAGAPLEFFSGKEYVSVQYFVVRAVREWPETDGREKRWFDADAARDALEFESAQEILRAAVAHVRSTAGSATTSEHLKKRPSR